MSSDDEVVCISSNESDILGSDKDIEPQNWKKVLPSLSSPPRTRKSRKNISPIVQLSDSDDDLPSIPSPMNVKRKKPNTATNLKDKAKRKATCKITLPKNKILKKSSTQIKDASKLASPSPEDSNFCIPDSPPLGNSPSKSSPKKKKTLADIVTDIHETSTDEIDSDEISASNEKLKLASSSSDPLPQNIFYPSAATNSLSLNNEKPCCSKSLQKNFSPKMNRSPISYNVSDSDSDDLPDIIDQAGGKGNYFNENINPLLTHSDEDDLPDLDGDGGLIQTPAYFPQTYSSSVSSLLSSQQSTSTVSSSVTVSSKSSSSASSITKPTFQVTKPKQVKKRKGPSGPSVEEIFQKLAKKEAARLEKEMKKQEEERAKAVRKATSELQRSVKPGESIKYMTILLDSKIESRFDSLVSHFIAAEIKCEVVSDPKTENSISFKREIMQQGMGDDLQIKLLSKFVDEDQIVIFTDSDTIIPLIHAGLNKQEDDEIDLITWVESIKSSYPQKIFTIFLFDMEKYFKKIKKNTQQDFRNRVLNTAGDAPKGRKKRAQSFPDVTATEVDSSLIQMQLMTGVNYRMIKNVNELAFTLIQYAKAIADAPFKKQRIESHGFDWFALADATGSVKVEKDGSGLKRLWTEQLQQFNSVGADVASAIVNQYSSPMKLMEAYQACLNQEEGQSLLKDVSVISGIGPLKRTRKVGLEASKKFYRFFTSTNGDRFLGSTSDSR